MENDKVVPDFSTPLDAGEYGQYTLNGRYDWIRVFPWLKWAVLNVVTEQGVAQLHMPQETAERVHEASRLPMVEMDYILDTDYEKYIEASANNLDESWFQE